MKRTLITGGAGFLGSHLCDYFLDKGHEVICMDNLLTGDLNNIKHINNSRFQFVEHNVTKDIDVKGRLDYILHFASPASPIDYLELPIQTLKVGSLGTHNALGLAKDKKAVFLLASTSEVYGDPLLHPQKEDYWGNVNPIGPRGVYDEAKRFAEAITMAYHYYHKVETRVVRIFNTYGSRMRINDGRAIPNFFCQAVKGEDLTVFGDGSQTRSFCYYTDLIDGIYRLLMSKENQPVNIGNPDEITLLSIAKKIVEITKSSSKITFKPLPVDDPKIRQPDITKAREIINWSPKIDLDQGLTNTFEYFKSKISTNDNDKKLA